MFFNASFVHIFVENYLMDSFLLLSRLNSVNYWEIINIKFEFN